LMRRPAPHRRKAVVIGVSLNAGAPAKPPMLAPSRPEVVAAAGAELRASEGRSEGGGLEGGCSGRPCGESLALKGQPRRPPGDAERPSAPLERSRGSEGKCQNKFFFF
jgi:hypothetical protein